LVAYTNQKFTCSDSVRSSAYSDGAARLLHLSITRTQLLPHLTMHHRLIALWIKYSRNASR